MGKQPWDYAFIATCLRRDGLGIAILSHVRAVRAVRKEAKIAILFTEPQLSTWRSRLPAGVSVVDLGNRVGRDRVPEAVFELLSNERPRIIHNISSPLGWRAFARGIRPLAEHSALYASVYDSEFRTDGLRVSSYYHPYLTELYPSLRGIFVDNSTFVRSFGSSGKSLDKVKVAYFPVDVALSSPRPAGPKERPKALWAGRFSGQKRLDVLCKIAWLAPDWDFHVFGGEGRLLRSVRKDLAPLRNVVFRGGYDGFQQIPAKDFDAFVYTSEFDGMPNVVLEATASGLPVIAPVSGAVGELIGPETGYPVSQFSALPEYLDRLREIRRDPDDACRRVRKAQALLEQRHSREAFISALRGCPGYL